MSRVTPGLRGNDASRAASRYKEEREPGARDQTRRPEQKTGAEDRTGPAKLCECAPPLVRAAAMRRVGSCCETFSDGRKL